MTKYFEALKEYNHGKDKWCMPKKGSDDYKLIIKIIEKNKVINPSSKEPKVKVPKEPKVKVPKEPKVKVPKEPKVKVPKEPKVKVPKEPKVKVPKEPKVKVPKEPKVKVPKEPKVKVPKEPKVKVPKEPKVKVPKEPKEPNVKVPKEPKVKVLKSKTVIKFPISMKLLSNKKYSKSSIKNGGKRSSVFIKQVDNEQNANIIANFLKNKLIKDKYTLTNRIAFYKYINNLLVDINGDECLESKIFKSKKGYTINNKVNLYKKIGTESNFGVIYLTSIVNSFGGFTIASKVMPNNEDNIKEIKIMTFLRDKVLLKNISKHFVFMYKYAICNKNPFDDKNRIVCVNELAHGDLNMLMDDEEILEDDELMLNLLFQTFISIGTFHNITGYVHKDCHNGNFLYQKNNEKGYYEYSFNGKSYYLKSCGYNIMIYDFGLSEEIVNQNGSIETSNHVYDDYKRRSSDSTNDDSGARIETSNPVYDDYKRITGAFTNDDNGGWIEHEDLPSPYVIKTVKVIISKLEHTAAIGYIDKNDFIKEVIETILDSASPKDMWITKRPLNVINKIAYNIS